MPETAAEASHQYDPESSLQTAVIWSSGELLQFDNTTPRSLKKLKDSTASDRSRGSCVRQLRFTEPPSMGWGGMTSSFGCGNSSGEKRETKFSGCVT